jgi:hypothetical protein
MHKQAFRAGALSRILVVRGPAIRQRVDARVWARLGEEGVNAYQSWSH